ncbi:MAG: hypothetical protein N2038_06855 [Geminicoccaceae bacterium]|nr:hypothetical protein [Geminicoccaceae bacterium]MCS7267140.1 hypothetical protein [Geminicoccaceae bacterium]MCX7629954.1 hypothetical protein [Geminicoccaceae bacterium]MDW8125725.1 hypothetical protein [Geminicoccaceae bacterium]MDW8342682.1 hypothetical protein [Geminicoccaceae bacterium]
MIALRASFLASALAVSAAGPAHAGPADVAGRWTSSGKEPIAFALLVRGSGFEVRLDRAGRPLFAGSFVPTDRPGVFEAGASGLFAVLGRKRKAANPLEGEELVWGRAIPAGLVLSRLSIADGRPTIHRALVERRGERLALRLERLEGESLRAEAEVLLEPVRP